MSDNRLFIETIKVSDGAAVAIEYHQRRMDATAARFFPAARLPRLADLAREFQPDGLNKLRVVYGAHGVQSVECAPYTMRSVKSLKVVDGADIDYSFKSADRSRLNLLLALKGECDDILITKNGLVTDTSFSNIAIFDGRKWLTPKFPLLCGTKRAFLLEHGLVEEADIAIGDLMSASHVRLFNAMIEFGEMELEPGSVVV